MIEQEREGGAEGCEGKPAYFVFVTPTPCGEEEGRDKKLLSCLLRVGLMEGRGRAACCQFDAFACDALRATYLGACSDMWRALVFVFAVTFADGLTALLTFQALASARRTQFPVASI